MRLAVLAVFLFAVPAAFCQSPQFGLNPGRPQPAPPAFQFPGKDFSNSPPTWQSLSHAEPLVLVLPRPPARPQIDPNFIIHPPKPRMADQPEGSLVAQNVFPGLRFVPIGSAATLKQIPIDWPKLKIESIPIDSPKSKLLPIESSVTIDPPPQK
jgi:hypothetical protein